MPPHSSTSSRVIFFRPSAVGDGDFEGVGAAAVRLDLGLRLLREVVARVVVEGHVRALAREDLADGGADAARPASHERALPFEKKTQDNGLQFDAHARDPSAEARGNC